MVKSSFEAIWVGCVYLLPHWLWPAAHELCHIVGIATFRLTFNAWVRLMQCCFHCQKPALGIVGEDGGLDTVYLSQTDTEILDNKAYGAYHKSCLERTPWSARWAEAMMHNLISICGFELQTVQGIEILFDRLFLAAFVHFPSSHRCISFSSWSIDPETFDCEHLIVDEEIHWELGEYFDACRSTLNPMLTSGSVSLAAIANLFGVESYYSNLVKSKGLFLETKDTERYFQQGYLSGRCRYPLELPASVQRAVIEGFARAKQISF